MIGRIWQWLFGAPEIIGKNEAVKRLLTLTERERWEAIRRAVWKDTPQTEDRH